MNPTTREDVMEAACKVIMSRGDSDLWTALKNRVKEYGEEEQIADEVNRWLKNMPTTRIASEEDEWLSNLP
jgi:hypothetical protein